VQDDAPQSAEAETDDAAADDDAAEAARQPWVDVPYDGYVLVVKR